VSLVRFVPLHCANDLVPLFSGVYAICNLTIGININPFFERPIAISLSMLYHNAVRLHLVLEFKNFTVMTTLVFMHLKTSSTAIVK
jgi:hypothetical protein